MNPATTMGIFEEIKMEQLAVEKSLILAEGQIKTLQEKLTIEQTKRKELEEEIKKFREEKAKMERGKLISEAISKIGLPEYAITDAFVNLLHNVKESEIDELIKDRKSILTNLRLVSNRPVSDRIITEEEIKDALRY